MSWFEPVHAGQPPAGAALSVSSTICRSASRLQRGGDEREVEGQVQLVAAVSVVVGQRLDSCTGVSPMSDPRRVVGLGQRPPPPDHVVDLGAVAVVDGALPEELRLEVVVVGGRRVVPEQGVLDDHVAHVDPEPGHAPVEPEPKMASNSSADLVVPPVEVGLLATDGCAGSTGRWSGRGSRPAPRSCSPSCWGPSRRAWGRPRRTSRGWAPSATNGSRRTRVLVAGVVGDQVEEDPDAASARPRRPGGRVVHRCRGRGATAQ